MQDETQRIIVGRISGIYGIRGWLKIISYTRPRENILDFEQWFLNQDNAWHEMSLINGQPHGKGLIAQLGGIEDRELARALVGADIAVDKAQLKATGPGEYYWHDLVGLDVRNKQDEYLGKVTELLETGANDVLVVEGDQRILIPFVVEQYILEIDLVNKQITVDWALEFSE